MVACGPTKPHVGTSAESSIQDASPYVARVLHNPHDSSGTGSVSRPPASQDDIVRLAGCEEAMALGRVGI